MRTARAQLISKSGPATTGERACKEDASAFTALVEPYRHALTRFCRRLMSSEASAEDLSQETLLRAYVSFGRLQHPDRFGAWLFGIAANLAKWWWREQGRWPVSLEGLAVEYPDINWEQLLPTATFPERILEEAERTSRLAEAIRSLPTALGQAVALYYLEGLSYAEVAVALEVPVSTVKGRLFKSRQRLRRALASEYAPREPRKPRTSRQSIDEKGAKVMTLTAVEPPTNGAMVRMTVHAVQNRIGEATIENARGLLNRTILVPTPADLAPAAGQLAQTLSALDASIREPTSQIVLRDAEGGERQLSILISQGEGAALAMHQQGQVSPRPLSHDLMASLVEAGGLQIERVVVTRLEGDTFYANVVLRDAQNHLSEVDARPSDAINLAVRTGAPIFAAENLLSRVPPEK